MASIAGLAVVISALMALQSTLGLIFPDQYRDPAWIQAAWFGNDLVTLFLAGPLLLYGAIGVTRGSQRELLLTLGLVAYAAYNYAYYMLGASLSVFFPLHVAAFVLSVATLIVGLSRVDASYLAAGFHPSTPVHLLGAYFALVGAGLTSCWIAMWAAFVFFGRPAPVPTEVFKLVAALDLSLMVPLLVAGGTLLWRRRDWGFIIATVAAVQASLYLIVLTVSSIVAMQRDLPGAREFPLWGVLAALTTVAALVLLAGSPSIREVPARPQSARSVHAP